jgi:hypothetical protein
VVSQIASNYDGLRMTAEYHQHGVQFLYPDNWQLVSDDQRGWPRSVSVHSPQGAFWAVTLDQDSAEGLLERMVELMQREYEGAECEPISRSVGRWMFSGVELHFYCLDLLVTAQLLRCAELTQPAVLLLQGEDRDFDRLVQVFDAITLSFLQHLA